MHILLVDDNAYAAKSAELMLRGDGHEISVARRGDEAVELAQVGAYDAILLSFDLEDDAGPATLAALRAQGVRAPVVILSADDAVERKVLALASGADDYVTRPFHKAELAARIKAVIRRSGGRVESILQVGPIAIDLAAHSVEVAGKPVRLTPSEYKLLELFLTRKNMVLTKPNLLHHLYEGADEVEPKIIDVFVCKLRRKIAQATGGDSQIETVWGGGYMLRDAREQRMAA